MLEYNLFGYEVEIDKNATTAWYTASNVWGCECGDCRNFLAFRWQTGAECKRYCGRCERNHYEAVQSRLDRPAVKTAYRRSY